MIVECFLDTNVLLYAASNAPDDALRRQIALQLLAKSDFGVSIQLLQEFYHNCRVKARLRIGRQGQVSSGEQAHLIKQLAILRREAFGQTQHSGIFGQLSGLVAHGLHHRHTAQNGQHVCQHLRKIRRQLA